MHHLSISGWVPAISITAFRALSADRRDDMVQLCRRFRSGEHRHRKRQNHGKTDYHSDLTHPPTHVAA
jgi:hypothetical protein